MQTEVVDREDAGMIQSGCRPGFALETAEAVGVAGNRPGQDLDGDVTAKSGVARPVDLAHATGTKRRRDLVGAEACTGDQRHAIGSIKRRGCGCSKAHRAGGRVAQEPRQHGRATAFLRKPPPGERPIAHSVSVSMAIRVSKV